MLNTKIWELNKIRTKEKSILTITKIYYLRSLECDHHITPTRFDVIQHLAGFNLHITLRWTNLYFFKCVYLLEAFKSLRILFQPEDDDSYIMKQKLDNLIKQIWLTFEKEVERNSAKNENSFLQGITVQNLKSFQETIFLKYMYL